MFSTGWDLIYEFDKVGVIFSGLILFLFPWLYPKIIFLSWFWFVCSSSDKFSL